MSASLAPPPPGPPSPAPSASPPSGLGLGMSQAWSTCSRFGSPQMSGLLARALEVPHEDEARASARADDLDNASARAGAGLPHPADPAGAAARDARANNANARPASIAACSARRAMMALLPRVFIPIAHPFRASHADPA